MTKTLLQQQVKQLLLYALHGSHCCLLISGFCKLHQYKSICYTDIPDRLNLILWLLSILTIKPDVQGKQKRKKKRMRKRRQETPG